MSEPSTRRLVRLLGATFVGGLTVGFLPSVASATAPEPPAEQSTSAFCDNVPASYEPFTDVTGNKANIECAAAAGLTQGTSTPTLYNPGGVVSRAQMASFIARLIDKANELDVAGSPDLADLAEADDDESNDFTDSPDPAHEDNINRLAQAGIVLGGPGGLPATSYGGGQPVQRDQMASFINRAQDFLSDGVVDGDGFSSSSNYFTDDDDSVHEDNIQAIASRGIAIGDGIDTYNPRSGVTRDQMASFLVRHLADNHEAGLITDVPAPGTSGSGPVTAFAAGTYTFTNGDTSQDVTFDATNDVFTVDGSAASMAAFQAALSVADLVTFTDDASTTADADADRHALTNRSQASIVSGTVGNVNVIANTYFIIDPVSGVALSDSKDYTPGIYTVDGGAVAVGTFDDAINEGDTINVTGTAPDVTFALTNTTTSGSVSVLDLVTDQVGVDNLGDDPLTAQDAEYDYVAGSSANTYTVGGTSATLAEFEASLSVGDTLAVSRNADTQTFALTNVAPPAQTGEATFVFDALADTFTAAVGPDDVPFDYTGLVLTVDGAVVTELEFEDAFTSGDALFFRAEDPSTPAIEGRVDLTNADLTGPVDDIDLTLNTYDVLNDEGNQIEDDVAYTAPGARYFVNDTEETLADFELFLAEVDADTTPDDTITVVVTALATEHRLTTDEVIP